jgi:hypothetical protein
MSYTQTQSSARATRPLYAVTRSEATWLVKIYQKALKKAEMEPFRTFREDLETRKPAYLGKFNNSYNAAVQGTFYAMAMHLYTVIEGLFALAGDQNHNEKITALCMHLPTAHSIAYNSIAYLNWAVYNWHIQDNFITEELSDHCYEKTTCAICEFTGRAVFYFSTAYGLEQPVCEHCLCEYEPKDNDTEYVVEEESEDEDSEDEEESNDDDDPDYVCESDDEETEDESDSDASSNDTEETDVEGSEADTSEADTSEADTSASEEEAEKSFGCQGCSYEFRAGFKHGWRRAMKAMRTIAQRANEPEPPRCATCDTSHENLLKCSGHCGGLVRYCSERCQREDWAQHKLICKK